VHDENETPKIESTPIAAKNPLFRPRRCRVATYGAKWSLDPNLSNSRTVNHHPLKLRPIATTNMIAM